MSVYSIDKLMTEARRLAREYRAATGKTLPISAEIAVNDAISLLGLKPAENATSGHDAVMHYGEQELKVQVKGRAILNNNRGGHRLGKLKPEQDWDAIILVIMDEDYESREMYFADRETVIPASAETHNKRGSISLARFKNIGRLIWTAENGIEDEGYWSNQD